MWSNGDIFAVILCRCSPRHLNMQFDELNVQHNHKSSKYGSLFSDNFRLFHPYEQETVVVLGLSFALCWKFILMCSFHFHLLSLSVLPPMFCVRLCLICSSALVYLSVCFSFMFVCLFSSRVSYIPRVPVTRSSCVLCPLLAMVFGTSSVLYFSLVFFCCVAQCVPVSLSLWVPFSWTVTETPDTHSFYSIIYVPLQKHFLCECRILKPSFNLIAKCL